MRNAGARSALRGERRQADRDRCPPRAADAVLAGDARASAGRGAQIIGTVTKRTRAGDDANGAGDDAHRGYAGRGSVAADLLSRALTRKIGIMHEMGIANSVLDAVRTEMTLRIPDRIRARSACGLAKWRRSIRTRLRFCFEAIIRGRTWRRWNWRSSVCPRRHRCSVCRHEFVVREYDTRCPQCCEPRDYLHRRR